MTARRASHVLTVLIAAGAFVLSFTALSDLAAASGTPAVLAPVWALVVDLTIVAGTVARIALPASRYATGVLWAAAMVSVAGNAWHAAVFGAVGVAVAAVPPIALIAVTHLTVKLRAERTVVAARPEYMPRGVVPAVDLTAAIRDAA